MPPATRSKKNLVVAREAIVINVGGRPAEYRDIEVLNKRTGDREVIKDTDNPPVVEEDPGMPYAFKEGQRVHKDHPAVKANPGAFVPVDEYDGADE